MASNIQWTSEIPPDLIHFLFVALFSLLIGLEQREHHKDAQEGYPGIFHSLCFKPCPDILFLLTFNI